MALTGFSLHVIDLSDCPSTLHAAVEAAGIGLWEFLPPNRRGSISRSGLVLLGLEANDRLDAGALAAAVVPEDRAMIGDAIAQMLDPARRMPVNMEFRVATADRRGTRRLAVRGRASFDAEGRCVRAAGLFSDATDRQRAQDERDQAIDLLRGIGECTTDAIYAKDLDGRFLFANPATLAILGRDWDDVRGKTERDFHSDPQQAAFVMNVDQRIMRSQRAEVVEEVFDAAGRGRRIYLSAKSPLRNAAAEVIGVVGVSSDITALKRSEADLRSMTNELETRVRAEVAAREAAQARLSQAQRMEALGQLAGGIAHDFNNILQAFTSGALMIQHRPDETDRVARLAAMLVQAAERGASITRRLLTFARHGVLDRGPIAPVELLTAMRGVLALTLGPGIRIVVDADPALPDLSADRGHLEAVLVNLATNARDAMPNGGTLTFSAAVEVVDDPITHPVALPAGVYLRLDVTDTGFGMDAATMVRASEPFFTTKPVGQGTGLGLAMARGFAEQSGGGFHLASELGVGTTATLYLPRDDTPHHAPGIGQTSRRPAHVLVVDDEPLVRTVVAAMVGARGHDVVEAENAEAALERLEDGAPIDLLVTDLSMPGMDGLALIRAAQDRRPGLPAILLTAFPRDIPADATARQAFTLLRKPIDADNFAAQVERLLRAQSD